MKRIIFRNPFITEKDESIAKCYYEMAYTLLDTAHKHCKNEDGTFTYEGDELRLRSTKMLKLAAKRLGFRSVKDMQEYKNRHGHF